MNKPQIIIPEPPKINVKVDYNTTKLTKQTNIGTHKMITIEKSKILEIIELNPTLLIGKEIISKNINTDTLKILDVNLKCTHIQVETSSPSIKWINVNDLDDEITINSLDNYKPRITVKTLLHLYNK